MIIEDKNPIFKKRIGRIYAFCFEKPRTNYDIGKHLYSHSKYSMNIINKNTELFHIRRIVYSGPIGYKWKIKSKIEPILNVIKDSIGLQPKYRLILKNILDSKDFRSLVRWDFGFTNSYLILDLISVLSGITTSSIKMRKHMKTKFHFEKHKIPLAIHQIKKRAIIKYSKLNPIKNNQEILLKKIDTVEKIGLLLTKLPKSYLFKLSHLTPTSMYTTQFIESSFSIYEAMDDIYKEHYKQ